MIVITLSKPPKWLFARTITFAHNSHDCQKLQSGCLQDQDLLQYFEDSEVDMTLGFYKLYVCPEYQWHIHVYNLGQGFSEL